MEIYQKIIKERFKNEYCALAERHHNDPTKRFYHFGRVIDVTDNSVFISTEQGIEQFDFSEILDIHKVKPNKSKKVAKK